MVEMYKGSKYAEVISSVNQSAWKTIEPVLRIPYSRPDLGVRKKEKKQAKHDPKEKFVKKKKCVKSESEISKEEINSTRVSFTAFIMKLCITGEKKDYQLLYCLYNLKRGLKFMSTTLRKEGFAQLYMVGMKSKVDWEQIKQNKVSFTDIIIDYLLKSGTVCMIAANKKEVMTKVHNSDAPFIVLLASTDVNLPCQANLCVGSGWMIFRRSEESRKSLYDREVFNCGRRALTAGILVNGCSTIMATAFKQLDGIHYAVFDVTTGDFTMYERGCFIRRHGNILSVNEALFYKFCPKIQDWLMGKKSKKEDDGYCSRYTGGWLTDGYIIMRSGGLLLSPEDSENKDGRVRYLYKAVPLAYLAEKGGGKASNGQENILNGKPVRWRHTSLIFGSIVEVWNFIKDLGLQITNEEQFEVTETYHDDTSTDFDEAAD
ncbi:fructose-1,6-bisphosphatase 1 isoform X1 [Halyomorpha halys]|uniref:fructose-1,6-bisphosphatase 1 isoform X1 n=1 Tax=Halyomorpha halys TaxID=286706 RepID=UPI0006D4FAB7|nr:uncharacterized protein LOC106692375 isoform X1 [Halyomorpha halys]